MRADSTQPQTVAIVGAGAVGLGIAVALRMRGLHVAAYGRRGPRTHAQLWLAGARTAVDLATAVPRSSMVVLATKAHDVTAALHAHAGLFRHATHVLAIQNGMAARANLPARACRAIVYACAEREGEHAVWRQPLRLVLDGANEHAEAWRRVAHGGSIECELTSSFRRAQYLKLMINASINPLCAARGLSCGELAARPRAVSLAVEAAAEIACCALAAGVPMAAVNPETLVVTALRQMGSFSPSMLQDMRAHRPLEIAALLDDPIAKGIQLGIATPSLRRIRTELFKTLRTNQEGERDRGERRF